MIDVFILLWNSLGCGERLSQHSGVPVIKSPLETIPMFSSI